MSTELLNITPDPKVLLALTRTPLKELDALCELVDNGIDSFRTARLRGEPVAHPFIDIAIPGPSEISRNEGVVRVVDNGHGLDREELANSLKAGFSTKNRYDSLGLFGMGFNIATGKLGQRTVVTTARARDSFALRVTLDLPEVVRSQKFEVPVEQIPKPQGLEQGTAVQISRWWPAGSANENFAANLARVQKKLLRDQIGRRYSTILRRDPEKRVRIRINEGTIEPFEHCVWSEMRFVERQGWGVIPARFDFNEVVFVQKRCQADGSVMEDGDVCLECGGTAFQTVEERVRGWVGIQRFDDNNQFGIDLVRNGRAIRIGEKEAFFNFSSDLGESIKEYPTDQQTGRIIGEVHFDHVPVDFQKQDFERSSSEWRRAIEYLRGGSLLPSSWGDGPKNQSSVSKLFQGYRKVRNYGRADLYMGRYDEASKKAVRIGRDVERELYARFLAREAGYYDDSRWWEYVENATVPPVQQLEECAYCGFQNIPGAETCEDCGQVIRGKKCIACGMEIPLSSATCPQCEASQIPEVKEPWRCEVCRAVNGVDEESCGQCSSLRGMPDPLRRDVLHAGAEHLPQYSFESRTLTMPDGRKTEPIEVMAFRVGTLRPTWNGSAMPSIAIRTPGSVSVYLDTSHPLFTRLGVRPEVVVAVEAAQYLYTIHPDLNGKPDHSVSTIASQVLADAWGEQLGSGPECVRDELRTLFQRIADGAAAIMDAADFYEELDQFEQRELADRLISANILEQFGGLRMSGGYLRYAGPSVLARFFSRRPDGWFGTVWRDVLPNADEVGEAAADNARSQMVGTYARCLDDCAAFLRYAYTDPLLLVRARASGDYLEERLN